MSIGQLSRRTGVSIKQLREYERLGVVYTLGRSAGNYRLFSDEALWCVRVVQGLRALGMTLKEIQTLAMRYGVHEPDESLAVLLNDHLTRAGARIGAQIADLQAAQRRIQEFQTAYRVGTTLSPELMRLLAEAPRHGSTSEIA